MTDWQRERLAQLLDEVLPRHPFYQEKFGTNRVRVEDFPRLPWTTKSELLAEQERFPPYGRLLTYPRDRYHRLHQTSGTLGQPLRWLDTAESWEWMLGCWQQIYDVVGVTKADRLFFPFSFGPFLGFWTGFEAACRRGCLCLAAGGLSTGARLRMLHDNAATVVLTTPTYALHLGEQAGGAIEGVRALILAGEPGANIPATRARIESAWKARAFDHSGMTEIGPHSIECPQGPGGLHILEDDYLAEIIDPQTEQPTPPGELGELVITNLGRVGSPLIRYRTADLVRVETEPCPCGRPWMKLAGGILGRTDDMVSIRGNNVYPGALENILRKFSEVVEFRIEIDLTSTLAELRIEVEPRAEGKNEDLVERIALAMRDALLFRADVRLVPPGSLPRFEMKARRVYKKTS